MHDEVEEFYDSNPQREWDRLCGDYYHSLEFWTTLHLFRKFLPPPPARILDCGGGPGRYSIAFTKLGYRVTLLDLSRNLLETARYRADKAGIVLEDYVQASATEIPSANCFYDGVLLAGPLYHLIANEDRAKAIQESLRVLKPGGVVAAAIIPLLGVFRSAIAEFPDFIESGAALRYLERPWQDKRAKDYTGGFTSAHFGDPWELKECYESMGCKTLTLAALEGLASSLVPQTNQLAAKHAAGIWWQIHLATCTKPTIIGSSEHVLYIGRKPLLYPPK
jgi:ubiquinone/menaquinone biosynthesis C-methylase UbiE